MVEDGAKPISPASKSTASQAERAARLQPCAVLDGQADAVDSVRTSTVTCASEGKRASRSR
jgi:hypothetical protein